MQKLVNVAVKAWKGFVWVMVMLAKLDKENRRRG